MTTKTNTPSNEKRNQVINDFGQKIGGAHKDRAREAAARLYGVDAPSLIAKPLGQVAKLPDLRALYTSGALTEEAARRAWYLWRQIGPKPASSRPWRVHDWADNAALLIAAVADTLAYGVTEKSQTPDGLRVAQSLDLFTEEMKAANWPADEYKPGTYYVGRHGMGSGAYSIHCPKSSYSKPFATVAEAVAAIREKVEGAAPKGPKFSVYKTSAGAYFIAPDGKPGIKLFEYATSAEAWEAYGDKEKLGARYNELRTFPNERRDWNRPRVGEDHRHGQDLSPESFAAVFPFRGVEFGNWVNQLERAACLNECADALHDLARVVGIIPEAVTLGGSLAWAFGSRGVGKFAAHYESGHRVVNLTKRSGNGCVAHEWFHALDNYLMIEAGRPSLFMVNDHHAYGNSEKSQLQESARLLKVELLNSQMKRRSDKIDTFKSKPYWGTVVEMAARGFEAFIYYKLEAAGLVNDYLVNFRMIEEYDRPDCYPYPTREEAAELAPYYEAFILAAFGDAERLNGADPEAEAAAYGEGEKSQSQELPAPPAAVVYDPAQPVVRAEFHTIEEVPAVAASLPMDADNPETSAPTGAAYGESQKSQTPDRMAEAINSELVVVDGAVMKHLKFCADDGTTYTNIGTAALLLPRAGFLVMPDGEGIPYSAAGGYKALREILQAGGFSTFEGFRFVWPLHHDAQTIARLRAAYGDWQKSLPGPEVHIEWPLHTTDDAPYGYWQKSQLCTVSLQVEEGPDGVAEFTGPTAEEAVRDMWHDDEDQDRDGLIFTIGDQRYTYQSVAMHYCFDHGRITFDEMLEMCVAE